MRIESTYSTFLLENYQAEENEEASCKVSGEQDSQLKLPNSRRRSNTFSSYKIDNNPDALETFAKTLDFPTSPSILRRSNTTTK